MHGISTMTSAKAGGLGGEQSSRPRRVIADFLAQFDCIARKSANFVVSRGTKFQSGNVEHEIPCYTYLGARGGDEALRIGIFAGIHGDEPEGTHALVHLVKFLEVVPEIAAGYCLSIYPICNPTGFEDNTRCSRGGHDLNQQFWTGSQVPEVRILEAEIERHSFHGIISLHTHEAGDAFYGIVRGQTFKNYLIEPALKAVESFLPRDEREVIEGAPASRGVVRDRTQGVLSARPGARPRPFEITLETPKAPPSFLKEFSLAVALRTILIEYRKLIAYAQNI